MIVGILKVAILVDMLDMARRNMAAVAIVVRCVAAALWRGH